jgi:hypothetical protein
MSRDSSDIDNALVQRLCSDSALLALCPDNVHINVAPAGSKRFVIVSVVDAQDVSIFGGRAIEDILYLVEARMLNTPAGGDIKGAAARIDALLEDQPLTVPGYGWMATFRENRERDDEVDGLDTTIQWARRGGHYRVQMAIDPGYSRVTNGAAMRVGR